MEQYPLEGAFDFVHYKAIYHFLFYDLYALAGQVCTVNISKKGTCFCHVEEIEQRAALIFDLLKKQDYSRNLPHDAFTDEIVDLYCATNDLHPFHKSNGHTRRDFLTQLIRSAGHDINRSEMDPDLLMIATIQAANGVKNPLKGMLDKGVFQSYHRYKR